MLRVTLLIGLALWGPSEVLAETVSTAPGRESGMCARGSEAGFQKRLWMSAHGGECDTCGTPGGMLWLDSFPFGADVFLGDERLGVTPFWLDVSRVGEKSVDLTYPGYQTRNIRLSEHSGPVLEVRLSPVREGPGSSVLAPEREQHGFLNARLLKWSLLMMSAGSAVAGLHFKDRADEAFDEYVHTGHSVRMREAFDRAEKNDRYALGCWIAAEVSLVGFLYLLAMSPDDHGWGLAAAFDEIDGRCGLEVRCNF